MQVLNASHVDLVSGGKSIDASAEPLPPPLLAPKPWQGSPIEP